MANDQPLIVILDTPPGFLIDRLARPSHHVVADDVKFLVVRTYKILQNGSDNRFHASRNYDSRNLVLQRPLEVLVEVRIELDVLHEVVYALREWFGD